MLPGILYLTLKLTISWVDMEEAVSSGDSFTIVREGPAEVERLRGRAWPAVGQLPTGDRSATRRCARGIMSLMEWAEWEENQLGVGDGGSGDGEGE